MNLFSLPIRDGNTTVLVKTDEELKFLFSLPIRDGNFFNESKEWWERLLFSLPIRDGNTAFKIF